MKKYHALPNSNGLCPQKVSDNRLEGFFHSGADSKFNIQKGQQRRLNVKGELTCLVLSPNNNCKMTMRQVNTLSFNSLRSEKVKYEIESQLNQKSK